jgi:hypothetical protein
MLLSATYTGHILKFVTTESAIFHTECWNGWLLLISINFEVTITFLAIWLVNPAQVIVTSCTVTITFLKMAPYCIDIMNEDIANFVYDSMQERTKWKTKNHEKYLTKSFYTRFQNYTTTVNARYARFSAAFFLLTFLLRQRHSGHQYSCSQENYMLYICLILQKNIHFDLI